MFIESDRGRPCAWLDWAARQIAEPGLQRGRVLRCSCGNIESLSVLHPRTHCVEAEIICASPQVIFASGFVRSLIAKICPPSKGDWLILAYDLSPARTPHAASIRIASLRADGLERLKLADRSAVLLVHESWMSDALDTAGEDSSWPNVIAAGTFHLPSELRAIARLAVEPDMSGGARLTYQAAKALELLCETIRLAALKKLIGQQQGNGLSLADSQRLVAARQLISEQFHCKLTLGSVARSCGLNRTKLALGFKAMFDCGVAEAIAEARLDAASLGLLTTDKPVASIGYDVGYLNNAGFARAFKRRYGVSPSAYRLRGTSRVPQPMSRGFDDAGAQS